MPRIPADEYLARAYALTTPTEARTLYNDWSSLYDTDLNGARYASPQRAVETILKHLPASQSQTAASNAASEQVLRILDAGCGTGLVGSHLATSSVLSDKFVLDGIDLSEGMLDIAREKNVYDSLRIANLNDPLPASDGFYDVVVCVGTLTEGHVGPGVLGEFVRVVKRGSGIVVVTVHEKVWESMGFRGEVERLESTGGVEVESVGEFGILEGEKAGGRMVVLRRT
ncbi:S-adenosyl-L-methionine-dependent methyltransferase [Aspergillus heterothallicus]